MQAALACSGRAVCRWLGIHRSTQCYEPRAVPERKRLLENEIVRLSRAHPTLGYKKIAGLLRELGHRVGKKLVQRVRREEGLQVPAPRTKVRRQGRSTGLPTKATHRNHVWSWDFVSDWTERGGAIRIFNLIDEFTRECHCIHADRKIRAEDVLSLLKEAIARNGTPCFIRSDNGPEFIAKVIQKWLADSKIGTLYIDPGCPWRNGYVESFNSRFRAECLNGELLHTLSESRVVFSDWRDDYNNERPHRSLGLLTPAQFAKQSLPAGPGSGRATPSLRRTPQSSTSTNQDRNYSHSNWTSL